MIRFARFAVRAGAAGSVLGLAHTAVNLRLLRTPPASRPQANERVSERVSVLVPARDEESRIAPCLHALREQAGVAAIEILVLDDCSNDRTASVAREAAGRDERVRVIAGTPPPPGWLGKPHACAQLAAAASGDVLVFVDADVVVAPHGIAATVELLRASGLDLISPYPRQIAVSAAERLVQPLLQWSWLTFLPLRAAGRPLRAAGRPLRRSTAALSAANGQLLAVDARAYRAAGGHEAVRGAVLDDLALVRSIKSAGGTGGVADGTSLARCRMYDGAAALREGYEKSLWAAFGSAGGATAVVAALGLLYVVPPLAALFGSRTGLAGYAAAVAGRALVARRVRGRVWPDALAHPASVVMFAALTTTSLRRRARRDLTWKGRPVVLAGP